MKSEVVTVAAAAVTPIGPGRNGPKGVAKHAQKREAWVFFFVVLVTSLPTPSKKLHQVPLGERPLLEDRIGILWLVRESNLVSPDTNPPRQTHETP